MKDLVDATIRYLQRQGKNAEVVSSRRPPTKLRVQGHQVKIEPLEDPRGVSRRVRVHVFDTAGGRGGPKLGSRDVTKSGKEIADAIIGILNRRVSESQLRQLIREEARRLTESRRYRSSEFIDDLVAGVGDEHMGYKVEKGEKSTVRLSASSSAGQRIEVRATPFFQGRTEDMTVSVSINGDIVRAGKMAFYGESMVEKIEEGRLESAAAMYKDAIAPVLEAGYGLAKIRQV